MNKMSIKEAVIAVLGEVQSASGLECPPLVGTVVPATDLPGFKSVLWPTTIDMISDAIGFEIPNDANIFVSKSGSKRLSIDEITDFILTKALQVTK